VGSAQLEVCRAPACKVHDAEKDNCRHLAGALGNLLDDLDGALAACSLLLPGDTRNVLVMALGLLAELRDPKSAARPALRMLPAPPRSPLAAVCADGQPATDLLTFR
jgi:hypothetical protein